MKIDSYVQVKVSRSVEWGVQYRTCLVENKPGLKRGNRITFKDDPVGIYWDIETVSGPIPIKAVHSTWHNNI